MTEMFSAEGLLEETFGYNFLQEVQAQGLIGVSARAAQSQGAAASYSGNSNICELPPRISSCRLHSRRELSERGEVNVDGSANFINLPSLSPPDFQPRLLQLTSS